MIKAGVDHLSPLPPSLFIFACVDTEVPWLPRTGSHSEPFSPWHLLSVPCRLDIQYFSDTGDPFKAQDTRVDALHATIKLRFRVLCLLICCTGFTVGDTSGYTIRSSTTAVLHSRRQTIKQPGPRDVCGCAYKKAFCTGTRARNQQSRTPTLLNRII